MFIDHFFELEQETKNLLKSMKPNFGYGQFGEIVYYRSYSRRILDPSTDAVIGQEHWADTVIRVIEGVFSIRYDWYRRNRIKWQYAWMQDYARNMAVSMFKMQWLPPGRGLWAMGTPLIAERGSMALYNCCFTNIAENWIGDLCWLMDSLMYGCGVGFEPKRTGLKLTPPISSYPWDVPDTREGWVESVARLLGAFDYGSDYYWQGLPLFDYSLIRPEGSLIKSFGGTASGPAPLASLHRTLYDLCHRYLQDDYDEGMLKTDIANLIGACVVTGNVRRSAELACAPITDDVFLKLKDYETNPHRAEWGWMSNNSVKLINDKDFERMDEIAYANICGHDLGYLNMQNFPKGRIGRNDVIEDTGTGLNPCGEIILEHREVCNVDDTFPTRCVDSQTWYRACEYATFYCSTVALLPTHQESTNKVVTRNRRIGVGLVDYTGWKFDIGVSESTRHLRKGYNVVRNTNRHLAAEAGVPESIRVTTVKPGGSTTKLAGRTPGAGHPTFRYTLRRIRVQENTILADTLLRAGLPCEPDQSTKQTLVFEYPIVQGPSRPAPSVSIWEQAMNVVLLQREWSDNSVSNTLYFNHKEEDQLDAVLSAIAPLVKSVSLLPHSDSGIFPQMPEEGITVGEYGRRMSSIRQIDFSSFRDSDGMDEKYCQGGKCDI